MFEINKAYRAKLNGTVYKIHVLAIIEGMIVFKYYGKHKQWWHYDIKHPQEIILV